MRDWNFKEVDFSTYPFYDKPDLGVFLRGQEVAVRIWAPTAREVLLLVYRKSSGGKPIRIDTMQKGEQGTWFLALSGAYSGLYYTLKVNDGRWLNETPGVDVRACGQNGLRGLFFDPGETNPEGWENDQPINVRNPTDAIIYEVHVRDFSIDPNSGMKHKGKFLAFTEGDTRSAEGLSTGLAHLKELGITHVHLLPVADYYSVDERYPDRNYNWGYDPLNYNTPEGSYATDPETISRIQELKRLVLALHREGIGVILDVVYNHTGHTENSWFNQTVPGYYYRQKEDGSFSNASGCGNELASERAMVRKYIIDSLCYWAEEFHVDGFRFDLMGVLDNETMLQVRRKLKRLNSSILLYGEGWTADKSPLNEKLRAVKYNISDLKGIACFNDDLRDALKGSHANGKERGFVSGRILHEEAVKFGIVAACYHPQVVYSYVESSSFPWAHDPGQCVNYVSCHDNFTLFDQLKMSCAADDDRMLRRMQKLAGAIILCSQGIAFLHAGVEFCRTKKGIENSYNSPDEINRLEWKRKKDYEDVFSYYCLLIHLRRQIPAFRFPYSGDICNHLHFSPVYKMGMISYLIRDFENSYHWDRLFIIFNASRKIQEVEFPESAKWFKVVEEDCFQPQGIGDPCGDSVFVDPVSTLMLACYREKN